MEGQLGKTVLHDLYALLDQVIALEGDGPVAPTEPTRKKKAAP
jgi:hypothetical protein